MTPVSMYLPTNTSFSLLQFSSLLPGHCAISFSKLTFSRQVIKPRILSSIYSNCLVKNRRFFLTNTSCQAAMKFLENGVIPDVIPSMSSFRSNQPICKLVVKYGNHEVSSGEILAFDETQSVPDVRL